jgi:hypothetical protein
MIVRRFRINEPLSARLPIVDHILRAQIAAINDYTVARSWPIGTLFKRIIALTNTPLTLLNNGAKLGLTESDLYYQDAQWAQ